MKYVWRRKIPKVGAFFNSVPVFSEEGKKKEEKAFSKLFSRLKKDKDIVNDSILWEKRIIHAHDIKKVLIKFAKAQVDAIIMINSAFPNGNVFTTLASDPYLFKIPIIITSDYEPAFKDNREWTTNAWCGVIMNNCAAKRMGRFVYPIAGYPLDKNLVAAMSMDGIRKSSVLPKEAMDIAKKSFLADMEAGFNLLHIDPTKDPYKKDPNLVMERTIELIEFLENARIKRGLGEIGYEVGTEDIQGGLTDNSVFRDFLKELTNQLKKKNFLCQILL